MKLLCTKKIYIHKNKSDSRDPKKIASYNFSLFFYCSINTLRLDLFHFPSLFQYDL